MNPSRSVRDVEGNEYPVTELGGKLWITANLQSTKFQNGDTIPMVNNDEEWEYHGEKGLPACCWYKNQSTGIARYGLLYNWFAVHDPRGLGPIGWRIPEISDWTELVSSLGGWNIAGRKLKSRSGWNNFGSGNNATGFNALPGGGRGALGSFLDMGDYGNWWCREEASEREASFFYVTFLDSSVKIQKDGFKASGLSIRCMRNQFGD
ncbi:MAG: fibrobacter succinogenes major paralogous domain-containing protein [Cyclobacteriaceae bacterium]